MPIQRTLNCKQAHIVPHFFYFREHHIHLNLVYIRAEISYSKRVVLLVKQLGLALCVSIHLVKDFAKGNPE